MPTRKRASVYRHEDGVALIEIRLREVRQLFHTLDPAPFLERDLDAEAERWLLDACREIGPRQPLRIVVHLPAAESTSEQGRTLADAVHHYFDYRQRQAGAEIVRLLRQGGVSFAIGVAFLVICLSLRQLLAASTALDSIALDEGLLILGWVALWRPTEMLLYDWWPLWRRRVLLRRIAGTPLEVRPSGALGPEESARADA